MKITAIQLTNVKGFKSLAKADFSNSLNVFIGQNNTGKSTILNSIYSIQRGSAIGGDSVTLGEQQGEIMLHYKGEHMTYIGSDVEYGRLLIRLPAIQLNQVRSNNSRNPISNIPEIEPVNLIYPFLSKRKVGGYNNVINGSSANSVSGNFSNLYAKIDRLVTPEFQPGNKQYIKACNDILGFKISTLAKGNGKEAVYYVHNLEHIPLTSMGEGVANLLGLITDLCVAENKIFLIEEPENDIHPKALKALLKLIISKSDTNQFFISTHSNIVMKYLGAADGSKVFHITNDECDESREFMMLSSLREIGNSAEDRIRVLEELGYDFFDSDLWKAWLFLEESSAEQIIRDYLIRWFVPELQNNLRTFSARSTSQIEQKFEDFNNLFVFLHLEPTYKNRVWVYIDSGDKENEIISKMKGIYTKSGWDESRFNQFSEHEFERYYPPIFSDKVNMVLAIENKKQKMNAKAELLHEVIEWIKSNEDLAKTNFESSASEIINVLKNINNQLG